MNYYKLICILVVVVLAFALIVDFVAPAITGIDGAGVVDLFVALAGDAGTQSQPDLTGFPTGN